MPILVLLRHAKSDYPSGVPDHERPLSARGMRNAETIARYLSEFLPAEATVDVAVSTAARTQRTWQVVAPHITRPGQLWSDASLYLAAPSTIEEVATCFDSHVGIIVGHNPGLEDLAASFPAADSQIRSAMTEKFPTAAFAVVAIPGNGWTDWRSRDSTCVAFVTCR